MTKQDLKKLTLKELIEKKDAIKQRCAHWQICQDGSYEMALHYAGYNDYMNEIYRRETE